MYYLDPEDMTLDAELHPSISYLFGWREHRYRYYYYYPQYTPDFSLLDEPTESKKEEQTEVVKAEGDKATDVAAEDTKDTKKVAKEDAKNK